MLLLEFELENIISMLLLLDFFWVMIFGYGFFLGMFGVIFLLLVFYIDDMMKYEVFVWSLLLLLLSMGVFVVLVMLNEKDDGVIKKMMKSSNIECSS